MEQVNVKRWVGSGSKPHQLSQLCLQALVTARNSTEIFVKQHPYNALHWVELGEIYLELSYPELASTCGYKAILLMEVVEARQEESILRKLLSKHGIDVKINAEIQRLRLRKIGIESAAENRANTYQRAYRLLILALSQIMAYKDGLAQAIAANNLWPHVNSFEDAKNAFKELWSEYVEDLRQEPGLTDEERNVRAGQGCIVKVVYPWIEDQRLLKRTPELLAIVNLELPTTIRCSSLEPTVSHDDVGPLGLFAVTTLAAGANVLIDKSSTAISNKSSDSSEQCDNCHASLHPSVLPPTRRLLPSCCGLVAYCSLYCLNSGFHFHAINCLKPESKLYIESGLSKSPRYDTSWDYLLIHRVISIIRMDELISKNSQPPIHPLQHPLISRLTAGYNDRSSSEPSHSSAISWSLESHVIKPMLSMLTLGIDPFSDFDYSGAGETVNIIYARLDNNACKVRSMVADKGHLDNKGYFKRGFRQGQPIYLYEAAWELVGLYPGFVFLNHGCRPNVVWGTAEGIAEPAVMHEGIGRGHWVDLPKGVASTADDEDGKTWIPFGSSTMIMTAIREIQQGEQLTIGYVPKGFEDGLGKWFQGGCECIDCVDKIVETEVN